MAQRNDLIPQSLDDDAVVDIIRDLQVAGTLGVLNVSDGIVPVYLLGQRTAFAFEVQTPSFDAAEWFSVGELTNPGSTVLADTGQLVAGTYDVQIIVESSAAGSMRFEHRNAANAADVNAQFISTNVGGGSVWSLALTALANERFRVFNIAAPGAGVLVQASVLAARRG